MSDLKEQFAKMDADLAADNANRFEYLKDKSPIEVLTWIMRAGGTPLDIRTKAAIALLKAEAKPGLQWCPDE